MALKATVANRLASSLAYNKILIQYNDLLKKDGKVNNKLFFEKYVEPEIPNYSLQAWYQFLKKFKLEAGLGQIEVMNQSVQSMTAEVHQEVTHELTTTLLNNQQATAAFIQSALNIGAARAKMILENPQLLTAKEALDLSIKAMKAQDSRIHAIGKVREDNREQEKFERTFDSAAYGT